MASWSLSPEAELDEAITWFRKRLAISSAEMVALEENARRTSFWMAKVATAQRAKRIQDSLQDALAHGMTFETWRRTNRGILRGIREDHLATTFRNWTQTSYNAARVQYLSDPQVMKRRPYWVFDAVMDGRTTPVCVAYDGTVLPAKHPWFMSHTPPLHHNCRSSIRGLTEAQARQLGIRKRAPAPKLTASKAEGTDLMPQPVAPAAGFGTHLREQWTPSSKKLPAGFKITRPAEIAAPGAALSPPAPPAPKPAPKPPAPKAPPAPRRFRTEAEWVASLTPEQREAVTEWTKGSFRAIRELDMGRVPTAEQIAYSDRSLEELKRYHRDLTEAMRTAPVYRGPISRGVGALTAAEVERMAQVGAEIEVGAFSSYSTKSETARDYALRNSRVRGTQGAQESVVFEVRRPKGGAHNITPLSNYSIEDEVLVTRGSRYRVTNVRQESKTFGAGSELERTEFYTVIEMEQIQ